MASAYRRKKGTPTVQMHMYIEPDVKDLLDRYAEVSGLPQWAIVEAAIRAGKPDHTGLPASWNLPTFDQGGLPLSA